MVIRRISQGEGFSYQTVHGERIHDLDQLDQIKKLRIPPAWTNVVINLSQQSKIRAYGYDSKGRKQYIYDPKFVEQRAEQKYDKLIDFAARLPRLRRITAAHLRRPAHDRLQVLACMVRLLEHAYFRPGNEAYAKENQHFGLTTLQSRHVHIVGNQLIFHFIGKKGVEQTKKVVDMRLAQIVRELDAMPGYEIFKYVDEHGLLHHVTSDVLNDYIKDTMDGDFTAKEFRTWAGTYLTATELARLGVAESKTAREEAVREAIKQTAEQLGNTPTVARSSYVDPRVIEDYHRGRTLDGFLPSPAAIKHHFLSREEWALLHMLIADLPERQRVLFRY